MSPKPFIHSAVTCALTVPFWTCSQKPHASNEVWSVRESARRIENSGAAIPNVPDIRDHVVRHLQKQITRSDLNGSLTQRSWNMHLDSPLDAERFAADLELPLAEYNLGHVSPEQLQDAWNDLLRRAWPVAAGV